ncbi:hypothetical protein E5Z02_28445, partial [Streptomyces rhizosphaericola]
MSDQQTVEPVRVPPTEAAAPTTPPAVPEVPAAPRPPRRALRAAISTRTLLSGLGAGAMMALA